MTDVLLRMLLWVTIGLTLVLLLRRPARRAFGAGPAFTLWLLPPVLMVAPLVPHGLAPAATWSLPVLVVMPRPAMDMHAVAPLDWTYWFIALWLTGVVTVLVRLVVCYVRLRRSAGRHAPEALRLLVSAVSELDPRRVRTHPAGPAVLWALPRTLILLPEDFTNRFGSAAARELVLRHELVHVRRGDPWWNLAMEIVSAALWFHPLAWFARPRFRLDQELACDARSLRELPQRSASYARALLESTAVPAAPALIPWLTAPQLNERIAMITRVPPGTLRRCAGFLAVATLLVGAIVLAGGQTAVARQTVASGSSAPTPPSVDPAFENSHSPRYPAPAIKKGETGTVMLRVTIDAKGKVTHVEVDPKGTTGPAELQTVAIEAARHWKLNPGLKAGKPVGGTLLVPVRFSLAPVDPCKAGEAYSPEVNKCVAQQSGPAAP